MLLLLIKGIIIGFAIAAPVGPIGLLCIQRTLNKNRLSGFVSGIGAATADACYGIIAAFGLTLISNFLINQQVWLKLIGGLFLVYLGINILIDKNHNKIDEDANKNTLSKDYFSTFLLTLTNPATILAFLAIFTSLNVINTYNKQLSALLLVFGIFTGSAVWWLVLSHFADLFKNKINPKYINIASALIITGFGIYRLQDRVER